MTSSGFISRNEFADVIKLILYGENGTGDVNDAYIEELTSAMDFDKNGKIDINEFLGRNNFIDHALIDDTSELIDGSNCLLDWLISREFPYCQCEETRRELGSEERRAESTSSQESFRTEWKCSTENSRLITFINANKMENQSFHSSSQIVVVVVFVIVMIISRRMKSSIFIYSKTIRQLTQTHRHTLISSDLSDHVLFAERR